MLQDQCRYGATIIHGAVTVSTSPASLNAAAHGGHSVCGYTLTLLHCCSPCQLWTCAVCAQLSRCHLPVDIVKQSSLHSTAFICLYSICHSSCGYSRHSVCPDVIVIKLWPSTPHHLSLWTYLHHYMSLWLLVMCVLLSAKHYSVTFSCYQSVATCHSVLSIEALLLISVSAVYAMILALIIYIVRNRVTVRDGQQIFLSTLSCIDPVVNQNICVLFSSECHLQLISKFGCYPTT